MGKEGAGCFCIKSKARERLYAVEGRIERQTNLGFYSPSSQIIPEILYCDNIIYKDKSIKSV